MATNQNTKRKDKARVVLRKGESQRKDGKYDFRWTSPDGKRHSIYAATLEELRKKENDIQRDSLEGIKAEARYTHHAGPAAHRRRRAAGRLDCRGHLGRGFGAADRCQDGFAEAGVA